MFDARAVRIFSELTKWKKAIRTHLMERNQVICAVFVKLPERVSCGLSFAHEKRKNLKCARNFFSCTLLAYSLPSSQQLTGISIFFFLKTFLHKYMISR